MSPAAAADAVTVIDVTIMSLLSVSVSQYSHCLTALFGPFRNEAADSPPSSNRDPSRVSLTATVSLTVISPPVLPLTLSQSLSLHPLDPITPGALPPCTCSLW